MDIRVNDILVMKKPHPCGGKALAGSAHRRGLPPAVPGLRPRADDTPVQGRKNIRSVERKNHRHLTLMPVVFSSPAADAAERTAGRGKLAARAGHGCDRLFPGEGVYFCHTGWR